MLVKRAAAGTDGELLQREAKLLRRARHPGVIELIDLVAEETSVVLLTAEPDGPCLADVNLASEEVAGVMAVLATTVADLHEIGVAHGALTADRIVLDGGGRPVVRGFDHSQALDGAPARWPMSAEARADTLALARLTKELLDGDAAQRDRATISLSRIVAPLLIAPERDRNRARMTARRLADEITTCIPQARLPVSRPCSTDSEEPQQARDPDPHPPLPMPHRRVAKLALATTIALAIVVACHPRPGRPHHAAVKAAVGPVAPRSTPTAARVLVATAVPPKYVGDVVTIGLDRYKVGETSDVMAFGRWSCTWPMLIIGRPRTGQVWLFRYLPATGRPAQAVEVGRVAGLVGVHGEPSGPCDRLFADRANASAIPVNVSFTG
ncbi:MAG TPA: hypothetical protein VNY84_00540 [Acidimicrobiales bacterium]|nr:hypothetical protein [Acidimicrobiales bacterium]